MAVIPVRQQFHHQPYRRQHGDCHRAALASLFEIGLDEVPHFAEDLPTVPTFNARVAVWLAERNLSSVTFPLQGKLPDVLLGVANSCSNAYWLLAGSSRAGGDHIVICRGPEIVHDPAPGIRGLAGPCSDGYWWATFLTPINPVHCKVRLQWNGVAAEGRIISWWKLILGLWS